MPKTQKTVPNRAIKARANATPDRIQKDITNAKAIIDRNIVDNAHHVFGCGTSHEAHG